MLDDTGIGMFRIRIVHGDIALVIIRIQDLFLESETAVVQLTKTIIEKLIDLARKQDTICQLAQYFPILEKSTFRRISTPSNRPSINLL